MAGLRTQNGVRIAEPPLRGVDAVPRSAFPNVVRRRKDPPGLETVAVSRETRSRTLPVSDEHEAYGVIAFRRGGGSLPQPTASSRATAERQIRVALLVQEEGLERGAMTRIAGWLGVSPSTIGRDVKALVAAGDPIVVAAADRAHRRKTNGNGASGH